MHDVSSISASRNFMHIIPWSKLFSFEQIIFIRYFYCCYFGNSICSRVMTSHLVLYTCHIITYLALMLEIKATINLCAVLCTKHLECQEQVVFLKRTETGGQGGVMLMISCRRVSVGPTQTFPLKFSNGCVIGIVSSPPFSIFPNVFSLFFPRFSL